MKKVNRVFVSVVLEEEELSPSYANLGDAGADLKSSEDRVVLPRSTELIPTGVSVAIPKGYVGFITPRSGLAAKHGITILNAPGTIDSGYRGELKVIIHNTGDTPFEINKYDRIGQLVLVPFVHAHFTPVDSLDTTARGEGGFGSTGV
jgi:dUTP pyrophosphatase